MTHTNSLSDSLSEVKGSDTPQLKGVIVAFQERLVSAEVIARYIESRARSTKPMADLARRIRIDLDWLLDVMDEEDEERNVQMEDAWGSPSDVKLVPNYRSIENMPEFIKEEEF